MRNYSKNKQVKRILAGILTIIMVFVSIDLSQFVSVEAATEYDTLYLIDNTAEKWVKNDNAKIKAINNSNGHTAYWMTQKDETTWSVKVPKSAYNITFNRYAEDKTTQWNSWSAGGRDKNNAYYVDGTEYGHWEIMEESEEYFHAGDVVYLDVSEFTQWKNDDAVMYVNFTDASKEENNGNDVLISSADKKMYNPKKVENKTEEYVYEYVVTEKDEGSTKLRFWRGNYTTLWNYSVVLSYEEYLKGLNCVKISAWNKGNLNTYTAVIDYDLDSDNDGIPDYNEKKIGTNINKSDSDNDGLNDYLELSIGYNPLSENSEEDGKKDYDNDGLSNIEEIKYGTDLTNADTDEDQLNDYEEIFVYGTDPLNKDTDGDGILDGVEIKFGTDPLVKNDGNKKISYTFNSKKIIDDYDENVYPEIELTGTLATLENFEVKAKENDTIINKMIPGYIGTAYEFSTSEKFDKAVVTFHIDKDLFKDNTFKPAIYYYNEENQILEELENQKVEGNAVSATLEHFSTYIVLNKTEFDKVWEEEIVFYTEEQKKNGMDFAFVIDASGSMSYDDTPKNDRNGLRLTLSKKMVEKMADKDRAMVVKFATTATLLQALTNDKDLISKAIDKVGSYGMTAMKDGIHIANMEYASHSDKTRNKIMIVITDGLDNSSTYSMNTIISEAKANGTKIYTIGLGSQINTSELIQIASQTGGKYYYASVSSDLNDIYDDIEDETVDYSLDSNNDGISDYHTKMLCEGKLTTGTGVPLFAGIPYEDVQSNDDYDGDGLKNGEEVKVKQYGKSAYITINSSPITAYSDTDAYTDYEESVTYHTNPLKNNVIMHDSVIKTLMNGDYYYASIYEEEYLNSASKQIFTWIGNNVYGSNYDEQEIYKDALVNYFTKINESTKEQEEVMEYAKMIQSYGYVVSQVVGEARIDIFSMITAGEKMDYILDLEKQIEHSRAALADLEKSRKAFTKAEFYEQYDKIQESIRTAASKSDELRASLNQEVVVRGTITTFEEGKSAKPKINTLGFACNILQEGIAAAEGFSDYCELKANLEVIQENLYVLEVIASDAYYDNLKKAANSLLTAARNRYASVVFEIMESVASATLNIALHTAIAEIPVVGFWIEISISVINLVMPVSDASLYAVRLCGISCIATELGNDLFRYIIGGIEKASDGSYVYAIYEDSAKKVVQRYENLVEIRKFGEENMITLQDMGPKFLKWLFKKLGSDGDTIINDCKETISTLDKLKYIYSYKCN